MKRLSPTETIEPFAAENAVPPAAIRRPCARRWPGPLVLFYGLLLVVAAIGVCQIIVRDGGETGAKERAKSGDGNSRSLADLRELFEGLNRQIQDGLRLKGLEERMVIGLNGNADAFIDSFFSYMVFYEGEREVLESGLSVLQDVLLANDYRKPFRVIVLRSEEGSIREYRTFTEDAKAGREVRKEAGKKGRKFDMVGAFVVDRDGWRTVDQASAEFGRGGGGF